MTKETSIQPWPLLVRKLFVWCIAWCPIRNLFLPAFTTVFCWGCNYTWKFSECFLTCIMNYKCNDFIAMMTWNAVSIHWLEQYSKRTHIFPFIHSRIEHESCDKIKKDGEILEYLVLLFRFWLLTAGNSGSVSSFLLMITLVVQK